MAGESESEPAVSEVEITVAGHTITVKAAVSLDDAAKVAYDLYKKTRLAATKIPFGFDTSAAQIEKAEQPDYAGPLEGDEEDRDAGLGRIQ